MNIHNALAVYGLMDVKLSYDSFKGLNFRELALKYNIKKCFECWTIKKGSSDLLLEL